MDDFPSRIAELLETLAAKVRAFTVDRVAYGVRWAALAPVILVFVISGLLLIGVGVFRILAEVTGGVRIAYAITGGLFVLTGALLWSRRTAKPEESE